MSRIAKGHKNPLFSKQALAQIAKSGGLQFSEMSAGSRVSAGFLILSFAMRNRIDIDHKHSRAIVREMGERLRASLEPEPELPPNFQTQINRLRDLERPSPSIIAAAEQRNKSPG
jgi:hypothetical protein